MEAEKEFDTKEKENNSNGWFCLSVCWIIGFTLLILLLSEYSYIAITGIYYSFWSSFFSIGIIEILYLLVLSPATVLFFKRHPLAIVIQERRVDRWYLEIIITGILCIAGMIWGVLPLIRYMRDITLGLAVSLAGSVFCAALLYGAVVLLVRKKVLKLTKSTSFFVKQYEQYKNRTPLEKAIARYHRGYRIGIRGYLVLSVVVLYGTWWFDENLVGMICWYIAIGMLVILLAYAAARNRVLSDAGKLVQGIQKLSESMETQELIELPEQSVFYEAAGGLLQIKKLVDENVKRQIQAERMKIELITNVSHDLKTPLTSMIGYTELLKKEELNPAAKDYVDIILEKQEKLADMIQDIFELSKAASNSEQLHIEALDMNKLVEQTMTDMEDTWKECEFTYVKQFAEGPLPFYGDNMKMYRVVQNILENTVKYSLAHTRVFIETEGDGELVRLKVKNTANYEMEFHPEEILERFTRGDKSRTSEGHGLGLAIASNLIENMNGKLYVETDGDVFKIIIEMKHI